VIDEEEITDELLKKLLISYVGLSKTEDKIIPRPEFGKLSQSDRVLLYLLARRAMVKLGIPGASFEADSSDVGESALVPRKSCGEILSRLKATGLIDKGPDGYFIPGHALLRVAGELGKQRK